MPSFSSKRLLFAVLLSTICVQTGTGDEGGRFKVLDPIRSINQIFHGNASLAWVPFEVPQPLLPTKEDLKDQTKEQNTQRLTFWMYMMGLTYMTTLITGTLTMRFSTRPWGKQQSYDHLHNEGVPAQISERKSIVAVVGAFTLTFTTCTAAVWWSLRTERLNKVNGLDWEVYWVLFSMNCLWQIAQAACKVCTAPGIDYNWSAFAEATIGGTLPFFFRLVRYPPRSDFCRPLFPVKQARATSDWNIKLDVFGCDPLGSCA